MRELNDPLSPRGPETVLPKAVRGATVAAWCGNGARAARRLAVSVVACLLAAVAAGCVEIDESLILERDGSGSYTIGYRTSAQSLDRMAYMAGTADLLAQAAGNRFPLRADTNNPVLLLFDEKAVRDEVTSYRKYGVYLSTLDVGRAHGTARVGIKMDFDDLEGLSRTIFFSRREMTLSKAGDGNYVLAFRVLPAKSGAAAAPAGSSAGETSQILAGFRYTGTVRVPGSVTRANTAQSAASSAEWSFNAKDDPMILRNLGRASVELAFVGEGADIPELMKQSAPE